MKQTIETLRKIKPFVYVASPYSNYHHGHDGAYDDICKLIGRMVGLGIHALSPIAAYHGPAPHIKGPEETRSFDFWQEINFGILSCAGALCVAKLPGWAASKGVAGEVAFALKNGIPTFLLPEYF